MNVWYVAMEFPSQAQHFLAVEVREMVRQGIRVTALGFRPPWRDSRRLAAEWDIADVPVDAPSWWRVAGQFIVGIRHPLLLAYLLIIAVWGIRHRPKKLVTAIVCCPRAILIARRARKESPDHIHLAWGHFPSLLGIALDKMHVQQSWSMTLAAYSLDLRFGPSLNASRTADFVRVISNAAFGDAREFGIESDKLRMIPRGQNVQTWVPPQDYQRTRYRILTTVRLVPRKRADLCIEVLNKLRVDGNPWELHIAGGGSPTRFKQLATDLGVEQHVRFLGHVSQSRLRTEAWDATFYIHLSDWGESLPNALKEAMAAACFCVVTESSGIEQLLESPRHGVVVPVGDIDSVIAGIRRGMNSETRVTTTSAAQRHVLEEFDVEKTVAELINEWRMPR